MTRAPAVTRSRSGVAIPILGTISPGHERYCPILADLLDGLWPGHGPLYYALAAGRTAPYDGVIHTDAVDWTAVLLAGLEHLRTTLGASHVFMLLEDHVPLWPCDGDLLSDLFTIAERERLMCIFFVKYKYEWPWRDTKSRLDPGGGATGSRQVDWVTIDGHRMARIPADYRCYNQCQPAIWQLDYYIALVKEAVRRGIADPWAFEAFAIPGQPEHFISEYRWPSRHCGYRRHGRVWWRSLYTMKMPEAKALRTELWRELFPKLPSPVRGVMAETLRWWGRLNRLPPTG